MPSAASSKKFRTLSRSSRAERSINHSYSLYINLAKRIFPLIALSLVIIVFVWPQVSTLFNPAREIKALPQKIAVENYLIEPSFTTTDANNRLFDIHADYAIQSYEEKTAQLSKPDTHLHIDPETTLSVQSKNGLFDEKNNQFSYQDAVTLKTSSGYNIQTDEATLLLNEKMAEGHQPVEGSGPAGQFQAEGFKVSEGGKKIELLGKSTLSLNPKKQAK